MRQKPTDQRQLLASTILQVRSLRATSRTALARHLGVSASTTGLYVDQLIATSFLHESGLEHGSMGRPKRMLRTRAEAGWFAGVEFNAERIQITGVDFSGQPILSAVRHLVSPLSTDCIMRTIQEMIATMTARAQSSLLAIGVGAPGIVDPQKGVALEYTFVTDWKQVPIVKILSAAFRVPVTLENNLRVIALAERWFGGGRDLDHYVILGPRSGFGIAMMQGGKVITGKSFAAGEIGRWPWPLDGKKETVELHLALCAPAIYRRLAGLEPTAPVPADLRLAFASLDAERRPAWSGVVEDFARVIACVQLMADPEVFFLHGPLTALGEAFCQDVVTAVRNLVPALARHPLQIVGSSLGDDAGSLGAASLAMEAWVPFEP